MEPHREVQGFGSVVDARGAQMGAGNHSLPGIDRDRAQIRVGGTQSPAMVDCDSEHAGDRASKADPTRASGRHCRAHRNAIVDSPVAGVAALRGETANDLSFDRRCQGHARGIEAGTHEQETNDGAQVFLPATAGSTDWNAPWRARGSSEPPRRYD